jgi:hypothetical protein
VFARPQVMCSMMVWPPLIHAINAQFMPFSAGLSGSGIERSFGSMRSLNGHVQILGEVRMLICPLTHLLKALDVRSVEMVSDSGNLRPTRFIRAMFSFEA